MYIATVFVVLSTYLPAPSSMEPNINFLGLVLAGGEEGGPKRQAQA